MKWIYKYCWLALNEVLTNRSQSQIHIGIGVLSIAVATSALALVQAFSEGVDKYQTLSYENSRLILGTLKVTPTGLAPFTTIQRKQLQWIIGETKDFDVYYTDSILGKEKLGDLLSNAVLLQRAEDGQLIAELYSWNGSKYNDKLLSNIDSSKVKSLSNLLNN